MTNCSHDSRVDERRKEVNPAGESDEGPLTPTAAMMLGYGADSGRRALCGQEPRSSTLREEKRERADSMPEGKDPGLTSSPMTGNCGLVESASPHSLSASPGEERREGECRTWWNWESHL